MRLLISFWVGILTFILALSLPIQAQQLRDYVIRDASVVFDGQAATATIVLIVTNEGTSATEDSDVVVRQLSAQGNRVLLEEPLAPIPNGQNRQLRYEIDLLPFEPGSEQVWRIEVGLDQFEVRNTQLALDNVEILEMTLPAVLGTPTPIPPTPTPIPPETRDVRPEVFAVVEDGLIVGGLRYTREEVAIGVSAFLLILFVFWLFTLLMRAIFRRPPRFGHWQPPYSVEPPYDQSTVPARRQAWQQHAQNNLLLAPPTDGNIHVVKSLVDETDRPLHGWTIRALRIMQYDNVGRVSQSEVLANHKYLRRLNRALANRHEWDEKRLSKELESITRPLVRRFRRRVDRSTLFLPVALDLRLEGDHDAVRIFFELYEYRGNAWFRIDRWEPTLLVLRARLIENFTFPMHGMMQDERPRDFFQRLEGDLTWLLHEMMRVERGVMLEESESSEPFDPGFNVPDTLSGMEPIDTAS